MARYIPRLYCPIPLHEGLSFTPEQGHYLIHVLRVKNNDPVIVFNGVDGEWVCQATNISKKSLTLDVTSLRRPQPQDPFPIWLAFGPLKGAALDFLIEKSVELGVTHLCPVYTDYTQGRTLKVDRLKKLIIEASEQCERLTLPTLHKPVILPEFLKAWNKPLFVGDERRTAPSLLRLLKDLPHQETGVLIGPEGGFSEAEFNLLEKHANVILMDLGPLVLKADTAALSALSVLNLWRG